MLNEQNVFVTMATSICPLRAKQAKKVSYCPYCIELSIDIVLLLDL